MTILYPLNDGIGSVELLDYMADDLAVVNAARVSYAKESIQFGRKDAKLIGFLMREGHGSPFEHSVFRFRIKAPLFVVRQWQRHRIASYNEQSGRWTEFEPEFYGPKRSLKLVGRVSYWVYRLLLRAGVPKEQARMALTQNLYTTFWFTVNARSLMNFIELRSGETAQSEIQLYAKDVEYLFEMILPQTHAAFVEHGRKAP